MPFCFGAARQNVLLLQLLLTGSVPEFDVKGVSSANLIGQRAFIKNSNRGKLVKGW